MESTHVAFLFDPDTFHSETQEAKLIKWKKIQVTHEPRNYLLGKRHMGGVLSVERAKALITGGQNSILWCFLIPFSVL